MNDVTAGERREARCIAVAATLAVVLYMFHHGRIVTYSYYQWAERGDRLEYWQLATGGISAAPAPWRWRVLQPMALGALPGDPQIPFFACTVAGLVCCGYLLYRLARLYVGHHLALIAAGLFYVNRWTGREAIWDVWRVDTLAYVFTLAAVVTAKQRQLAAFAALLVVGVLVKESVLFIAPMWWTMAPDRRSFRQAAGAAVPAVLTLGGLRLLFPAHYSMADRLDRWGFDRLADPMFWPWVLWGAFGFTLLLPLLSPRLAARAMLPYWPLAAGTFAQFLFAADTFRLAVNAFPMVFVGSVVAVDASLRRFQEAERSDALVDAGAKGLTRGR